MKTNEEIVKEYRDINGWQDKILNGEGYELTDEELVKAFGLKVCCGPEDIRKYILPMFDDPYVVDFEFNGCNCDNDCAWDGISHRCNCGNRRVYWLIETNRDGTKYAIAEAY